MFKFGLVLFVAAVIVWWTGVSAHGVRVLAAGLLLSSYCMVERSVKEHERRTAERKAQQAQS